MSKTHADILVAVRALKSSPQAITGLANGWHWQANGSDVIESKDKTLGGRVYTLPKAQGWFVAFNNHEIAEAVRLNKDENGFEFETQGDALTYAVATIFEWTLHQNATP